MFFCQNILIIVGKFLVFLINKQHLYHFQFFMCKISFITNFESLWSISFPPKICCAICPKHAPPQAFVNSIISYKYNYLSRWFAVQSLLKLNQPTCTKQWKTKVRRVLVSWSVSLRIERKRLCPSHPSITILLPGTHIDADHLFHRDSSIHFISFIFHSPPKSNAWF